MRNETLLTLKKTLKSLKPGPGLIKLFRKEKKLKVTGNHEYMNKN